MKKLLKFLGVFVVTSIGLFFGIYGCIRLDASINPWLKELTYSRWMWLTTRNGSTMSYLNGTADWWILTLIISTVLALWLAFMLTSSD